MSTLESDLWKQLLAEAGEAEIDATASVTVKEAEAELTAAGFDVAAERAKASAFLDALEDGTLDTEPQAPHSGAAVAVAQDPPPVHRTRRQRPVVFWLGAAAAAVVAGGALYAALHQSPTPGPTPLPPPPVPSTPAPLPSAVPDLIAAADLRHQAAAACDAAEWSACLEKLDRARAGDPAGDDAPAVKALRKRAIAGALEKKPVP